MTHPIALITAHLESNLIALRNDRNVSVIEQNDQNNPVIFIPAMMGVGLIFNFTKPWAIHQMLNIKSLKNLEEKIGEKLSLLDNLSLKGPGITLTDDEELDGLVLGKRHLRKLEEFADALVAIPALRKIRFYNDKTVDKNSTFAPDDDDDDDSSKIFGRPGANFEFIDIEPISKLTQITYLDLTGCSLTDISPLAPLTQLTELYLSDNRISSLAALKELKGLVRLTAVGNKINDISGVENMTSLRQLDLSYNKIKDIQSLKKLNQLQHLYLQGNKISDLWPLENLSSLKLIDIQNNEVVDLSPLMKVLENNGTSIFFFHNQVRHLPKPFYEAMAKQALNIESIISLKNYWALRQRYEEASQARDTEKALRQMEIIYRERVEHATSNPSKIRQLTTEYQASAADLTKKHKAMFIQAAFESNHCESPPYEIVKEGMEATLRYYKNLEENEVEELFEAKLILVGEGSSGKTSLQLRLVDPKAVLPESESRTRGISLSKWKIKTKENQSCIVNIWDFGGQDVYYPVHRFFLDEHSVYVLLGSTRQTNHNFDYWIQTISQFGENSPIILGQTCHGGLRVHWNELSNYISNANYNIIKTGTLPYHEINLPNNNEGLDKIKSTITDQIKNRDTYGRKVLAPYVKVRKYLSNYADTRPCINFDEFASICRQVDQVFFSEALAVEDCGKFLNAVGVIIWYYKHDELKSWIVLQPQWLIDAFYTIIDDAIVLNQAGSILTKDFTRIWGDKRFESKQNVLKRMLEVFKIAFPKKHKKTEYILPVRLNSIPENEKWTLRDDCIRIEYKYNFMPKGLVNQVSAELSRYIVSEKGVWNNAVNLENESRTALCQIEEDIFNRRILISARGRDARDLIVLGMNALKDVTEEYKGVSPELHVPCICKMCKESASPQSFLHKNLIRWIAADEDRTVVCNESGTTIKISELLFNVGLSKAPGKELSVVKIFLASSSELEKDRDEFQLFINEQNKNQISKGRFFEVVLWEEFIDAMSKTRLQDEYNKAAIGCHIFVSLFYTKAGCYTVEEFKTAFKHFTQNDKPLIYTYFKDAPVAPTLLKDYPSLLEFKKHLGELGHFPTMYSNISDLKYQFKMQLERLEAVGKI